MGFFNDIADAINSLANYKKADAEQIKAKTQKDKMKKLTKENKTLKKALSRNQIIGIVSILVGIAGIAITVFFIYFPIHNDQIPSTSQPESAKNIPSIQIINSDFSNNGGNGLVVNNQTIIK